MRSRIFYRKGYKYQLDSDYLVDLSRYDRAFRGYEAQLKFLEINREGLLLIRAGYAWDGCSGPTVDDRTNMRAGLVHDALCQLFRWKRLPRALVRSCDETFRAILKEDGMGAFRRWYYYKGVTVPDQTWTRPEGRRPVFFSP